MPEYEQTGTIMAEPDVLFDYLAEVEHLPEYLPVITEAEPAGPELAVVDGRHPRRRAAGRGLAAR